MRTAIGLIVTLLLTGCISAEEMAARQARAEAEQQARNKAYTDSLRAQCAAIGYQPNSDGFRQCILQLHSNNQASDSQARAVILQQLLQQQYQSLPYCSSLPAGISGYRRAQGTCR